jgi:cytoskeleton protein RodZ
MSMQELGKQFKAARQDAGLSLQEVYEQTKISLYVLESLERGDVAKLPHPVYTKGFIRNYAKLLGLDQERIVQEYIAAVGGPEDSLEIDPGVPELNVRRQTNSTNSKLRLILLGTAILAAAVWLVVSYFSREIRPVAPVVMEQNAGRDTGSDTGLEDPVPDREEEREPLDESAGMDRESVDTRNSPADDGQAPSSADSGISEPEEDHGSVKTEAEQPVSQPVEIVSERSEDVTEVTEDESLTPAQKVETVPDSSGIDSSSATTEPDEADLSTNTTAVVTKAHILRIEATHDCWLRATADKKTALYKTVRLLEPGQSANVPFNEDVELRLGNAGGVRLFVDDQPYPFDGNLGDVATVVVSAPAE